jgi:hypothetical protein
VGNSFGNAGANSDEIGRFGLFATEEEGNSNEEPAFRLGGGGRVDGDGIGSALAGNETVGKISASTSLFSQSFHAPLDRADLEIAFRKKAFEITWMFLIGPGFSTKAFAKTSIGLIQTFVLSFASSSSLSHAVFRKTCATKSFSGGRWLIRISPFTMMVPLQSGMLAFSARDWLLHKELLDSFSEVDETKSVSRDLPKLRSERVEVRESDADA